MQATHEREAENEAEPKEEELDDDEWTSRNREMEAQLSLSEHWAQKAREALEWTSVF